MTQLDAYESALMLTQLARAELRGQIDLRSQLADIRLKAAVEALKGNVNMETYEEKVLGPQVRRSGESE